MPSGGTIHIEEIQDQVELALMRAGEHEVARSYVLYREERAKERREKSEENSQADELLRISVDGELKALDENWLNQIIEEACSGYTDQVEPKSIYNSVFKNLYDGIKVDDLIKTLIMTSKTFIEKDPYMQKSQHSCSCTPFARKCSGVMYKRAKLRRRIKVISHDLLRRGYKLAF